MQTPFKICFRVVILGLPLLMLTGCGLIQPVQPWEKGNLAKPEMTIQGDDPFGSKFSEHVYYSREASTGGSGVGGGGCGCN